MKRCLIIALTFFVGTCAQAKSPGLGEIVCEANSSSTRNLDLANKPKSFVDEKENKGMIKSEQTGLPRADEPSIEVEYKYYGNSFSNKFHRPWCPFSQAMNIRHVIPFHFRYQAIAQGLKPCRYCLPPVWKSVQCRLLKANVNIPHQEPDLGGSLQETSKHQVQE